jgi:Ca2+-binding EF-hand superfamily protein
MEPGRWWDDDEFSDRQECVMKKRLVLGISLLLVPVAHAQDAALVFSALDTDHDGKISRAEAQKNPAVTEMFAQADKDHDGTLSKAEFEAAFGK